MAHDGFTTTEHNENHPLHQSIQRRRKPTYTAEEQRVLDSLMQQDNESMMQFDLNREEKRQIKKPLYKTA